MKCYERYEFDLRNYPSADRVLIRYPDGTEKMQEGFLYQPIALSYVPEGYEMCQAKGAPYYKARFTPNQAGSYHFTYYCGEKAVGESSDIAAPSDAHGWITVSQKDRRYFSYTDGTPFCPVGINLAFLTPYATSDKKEFGHSGGRLYLGLRQYERWFKKCSENGVNMARLWLGHEYFCPDSLQVGEFRPEQFSKIDEIVALARKYHITLKMTLEQFRFFNYDRVANSDSYSDDVFRKFNKKLYHGEQRCENAEEWMTEPLWKDGWKKKAKEFALRYGDDPIIFTFELWNETNCLGTYGESFDKVVAWNREMLPLLRSQVGHTMVVNSIGSFDAEQSEWFYRHFCWEDCDFYQMHSYLDMGAEKEICHNDIIDLMKDDFSRPRPIDAPMLMAETGAVNNHHSGPFCFYMSDDDGLIFADCVYSPFFLGSAGCGNIWHWDHRYVEAKSLFPMFRPFAELIDGIDLPQEEFVSQQYRNGNAEILALEGKTVTLLYVRNKANNWRTVLRDLQAPVPAEISYAAHKPVISRKIYPIWQKETAEISGKDILQIRSLHCGLLIKLCH